MTAPPRATSDRVCVAQIGGAHGVRGDVRVKSFTQDPASVTQYGSLEGEHGERFDIVAARPTNDALIVRFKGIDDRNAAETLRQVKLYVARDKLGGTDEDEFFHADLIGLAAVTTDGTALGTVTAVPNYGAGDLLEIAPPDGSPSILLPFTKAVAPKIDIAAGVITLDPPEGTFELSLRADVSPSPLAGEGGEERVFDPSRVRGMKPGSQIPSPASRPSPLGTLSRKGRG